MPLGDGFPEVLAAAQVGSPCASLLEDLNSIEAGRVAHGQRAGEALGAAGRLRDEGRLLFQRAAGENGDAGLLVDLHRARLRIRRYVEK